MTRSITQELSAVLNPDSEGTVRFRTWYRLPNCVTSLTLTYPHYLSVSDQNGFTTSGSQQCSWDEHTRSPWMEFWLDVNQSNGSGYEFYDAGNWALLSYPQMSVSWTSQGNSPELTNVYDVGKDGISSSDGNIVYLGPYNTQHFEAGGQQFRLAIPADASLRVSATKILSSLGHAAENLNVGNVDDDVVIVAAPSTVNWGWGGLQSGANGFWVVDSALVADANNIWVHEYVHTRQGWHRDDSTRWLIEGTTEFYAAYLTYLDGHISFSQFYNHLTTDQHCNSVLVDPGQWTSPSAHYTKGRRVTAALDAKIRQETDGAKSFMDVFRKMNQASVPMTHQRLEQLITAVVGHSLSDWLAKYVASSSVPEVPDDEQLFADETVSVDGPESGPGTDIEETEGISSFESCPICATSVEDDWEYCRTCGTALHEQCPVCARHTLDKTYCHECGTALRNECDICGYLQHRSDIYCPSCGNEF